MNNDMMTLEKKIKMALAYREINQAELARRIGMTPSNFNQKLKRDTFSTAELHKIASALEGVYRFQFEFPDGTKI